MNIVDPRMRELSRRLGPLEIKPVRNHFGFLAESIVNQQISTAAGLTLIRRLRAKVGSRQLRPEGILKLRPSSMRACGISASKVSYIQNVAAAFQRGGSLYRLRWQAMDDAEATRRLVAIKGIGPWTAEMFLMFALCRPDLWSPGDVALRRETAKLYGLKNTDALPARVEKLSLRWKPYRSWAARYIWWSADGKQEWGE